jgi:hypothetical protein
MDKANDALRRGIDKSGTRGSVSARVMGALGSTAAGGAGGFAYGYNSAPEGASEEEKLERGVFYALAGAGAGFGVFQGAAAVAGAGRGGRVNAPGGTATQTAGGAAKASKTPVLDKIHRHMSEPKGPPTPGLVSRWAQKIEKTLITKYAPLEAVEREVYRRAGLKPPSHGMARKFETWSGGASGQGMLDVRDFERVIGRRIKGREQDFSDLIFLRRARARLEAMRELAEKQAQTQLKPEGSWSEAERAIMAEDAGRYAIKDWDLMLVEDGLAEVEGRRGAEGMRELNESAQAFYGFMDMNLTRLRDAGVISPAQYDAIKKGPGDYAPFKVTDFVDEGEALDFPRKRDRAVQRLFFTSAARRFGCNRK